MPNIQDFGMPSFSISSCGIAIVKSKTDSIPALLSLVIKCGLTSGRSSGSNSSAFWEMLLILLQFRALFISRRAPYRTGR